MKQSELKKCAGCGKGMMRNSNPIFYRVRIERMCIDLSAVERRHGIELMLGRNSVLAAVMGPDEDLAKPLGDANNVLVCQDCSISRSIAVLDELASVEKEMEKEYANP